MKFVIALFALLSICNAVDFEVNPDPAGCPGCWSGMEEVTDEEDRAYFYGLQGVIEA